MPEEMRVNIDNGGIYESDDKTCRVWRINAKNLMFEDDNDPKYRGYVVWTFDELWEFMQVSGKNFTLAERSHNAP